MINTNYIIYIGCVQAVKSYLHKTGLAVEKNKSTDLTKTLKIIYSTEKVHASIMICYHRLSVNQTVVISRNIN